MQSLAQARSDRLSKTEKQKMLAGELYRPDDELGAEQAAASDAAKRGTRARIAIGLRACAGRRNAASIVGKGGCVGSSLPLRDAPARARSSAG